MAQVWPVQAVTLGSATYWEGGFMPVRLGAALLAEFVGSFALTFVGIMAIHFAPTATGGSGLLAVALAHRLVLGIMVTAIMYTSGRHVEPAITLPVLVT